MDWQRIASQMGQFTADVCKERHEYLKAKQAGSGPWTKKEDDKIAELVRFHGKKNHRWRTFLRTILICLNVL